jgi:hypothetical protein
MKTIIFIFILLGFSTVLYSQTDKVIGETLSKTNPDIDTLTGIKNQPIRFQYYDTLYYCNQIAVNDYINTRNNYFSLISTMQKILKGIQGDFITLNESIDLNNEIIKKSIEDNITRLNDLDAKNSQLTSTNLQISKDLQIANDKIAAARWKSFVPKLLYGGGGVVLGVGISALIISVSK